VNEVNVIFALDNGGMKGKRPGDPLSGRIEICDAGISIYFDGYGVKTMQPDCGSLLFIEFYQGELRFIMSPDITEERIDIYVMEGARERLREDGTE